MLWRTKQNWNNFPFVLGPCILCWCEKPTCVNYNILTWALDTIQFWSEQSVYTANSHMVRMEIYAHTNGDSCSLCLRIHNQVTRPPFKLREICNLVLIQCVEKPKCMHLTDLIQGTYYTFNQILCRDFFYLIIIVVVGSSQYSSAEPNTSFQRASEE